MSDRLPTSLSLGEQLLLWGFRPDGRRVDPLAGHGTTVAAAAGGLLQLALDDRLRVLDHERVEPAPATTGITWADGVLSVVQPGAVSRLDRHRPAGWMRVAPKLSAALGKGLVARGLAQQKLWGGIRAASDEQSELAWAHLRSILVDGRPADLLSDLALTVMRMETLGTHVLFRRDPLYADDRDWWRAPYERIDSDDSRLAGGTPVGVVLSGLRLFAVTPRTG